MKGAHPSVESDVWALGCVIFQMLVGRPPLWADSAGEMMQRIVHFEPEQLPAFPPGVSETAKGLVLSLLVRAPDRRLGGGGSGVGAVFGHAFFAGLPPLDRLYQTTPPTLDGGCALCIIVVVLVVVLAVVVVVVIMMILVFSKHMCHARTPSGCKLGM
ncbi:kinase-like domain-containing protein [Pavlovales sp. CCMP2436]|nr:kinase-like domain-containing protein [Pavlovales sp. CCMP2436]